MTALQTTPPHSVIPFTGLGAAVWQDYFVKQHQALKGIAKQTTENQFSERQKYRFNGEISDGGIMLQNKYWGGLDVMLSTKNVGSHPIGGQAAAYIQHSIDNGIATSNNVNSGIRVQTETQQQRSAGTLVNDVVGGYFGVRNRGVNVGAFGLHVDAYSNGTGASTTMYAMSAEMYRESNVGLTIAFHARTIDAVGYFDNDYAFLASPTGVGGVGTMRFRKAFSAGAAETGVLNCNYGLDLAYALCTTAAIRIKELTLFYWDGLGGQVFQVYDTVGEWQHWVSGTKNFALENTGRVFIVNNASTVYAAAGAASGSFLAINVGGTVYKLNLLNF